MVDTGSSLRTASVRLDELTAELKVLDAARKKASTEAIRSFFGRGLQEDPGRIFGWARGRSKASVSAVCPGIPQCLDIRH